MAVDKTPAPLSMDGEREPDSTGAVNGDKLLALTAIPTEVKQGEEQPSSAASPLHTLPTVSALQLSYKLGIGISSRQYVLHVLFTYLNFPYTRTYVHTHLFIH